MRMLKRSLACREGFKGELSCTFITRLPAQKSACRTSAAWPKCGHHVEATYTPTSEPRRLRFTITRSPAQGSACKLPWSQWPKPGHHAQGHLTPGAYPRRLARSKSAIRQLFANGFVSRSNMPRMLGWGVGAGSWSWLFLRGGHSVL